MGKSLGWLLAFLSILLYSVNSPIARGAILAGISPTTLLAARFVLASFLFGATFPLARGRLPAGRVQGERRPLDWRGVALCMGSGLTNGLSLYFLYQSLAFIGAGLSSMLMIGLYPLFTLLLLALRGERPGWWSGARLLLGAAGLYFLLEPGNEATMAGVILIVLASLFFSLHIVSVQWYLRPYSTWPVTAILVSSAAVVVTLIWVQEGGDTFVPGWVGWGAILIQAVFATYLGRLITYAAINHIGSAQFALLSPLETMLTVLWSALFLGELFSGRQGIGAVLILLSALLAADSGRLFQLAKRSKNKGFPSG